MSAQPAAGIPTRQRTHFSLIDLALLGVVLTWGFGYVPFRIGQQEIPTGLFNLLRYVLAVPILWLFLLRSGEDWRMPRRDLPRTVLIGLVGVLAYSMCFSAAAKITNAANIALLLALSPVLGVAMGWIGGRGAPTPRFAVGSAIAFAGAAMVIGSGAAHVGFSLSTLTGDLLAVVATLLWAWYGIVAQPLLRGHSGLKVQAWINLIALTGFVLYQGPAALRMNWSDVSPAAWLSLAYVAFVVTVYGHLVWYTAIAQAGANRVLLAMYLVPVLAALSGAVFLDQPLGVLQVLGGALALVGVAIVRRAQA